MGEKEDQALANHVSGQSNQPLSKPAHALPFSSVIEEIKANAEDGLTDTEAKARLETHGRNELSDADGVQPVKILIGQVANAMTLVCLFSTKHQDRTMLIM